MFLITILDAYVDFMSSQCSTAVLTLLYDRPANPMEIYGKNFPVYNTTKCKIDC